MPQRRSGGGGGGSFVDFGHHVSDCNAGILLLSLFISLILIVFILSIGEIGRITKHLFKWIVNAIYKGVGYIYLRLFTFFRW